MPITAIKKNLDDLTMTIVADFSAPVERLWDAYADPRQISKFWVPPRGPRRSFATTCSPAVAPPTS